MVLGECIERNSRGNASGLSHMLIYQLGLLNSLVLPSPCSLALFREFLQAF